MSLQRDVPRVRTYRGKIKQHFSKQDTYGALDCGKEPAGQAQGNRSGNPRTGTLC